LNGCRSLQVRVVALGTVNCRYGVFSFSPGLVDILVALGAQWSGFFNGNGSSVLQG